MTRTTSGSAQARAPLKAMHYCAGCNDAERPHDPSACCGGNGRCSAWTEEPACPYAETHDWLRRKIEWFGCYCRFEAECSLCGLLRTEEYFGVAREHGQCDRRRYEESYYTVYVRHLDADGLRKLAARWRSRALRASRNL